MADERRSMRLAYVVGAFPLVSLTFVLDQIAGLLERGHEVDVFAERSGTPEAHAELLRKYHLLERTSFRPSWSRQKFRRFAPLLRLSPARWISLLRSSQDTDLRSLVRYGAAAGAHRPSGSYDAIHAHFGTNGLLAMALRRLGVFSGPLVTTFHGVDMSQYVRSSGASAYRALFDEGALFLPVSDTWAGKLVEMGCPADRIEVHRMGVRLAELAASERTRNPGEPIELLSVARLVEKKGIAVALRALARLRVQGLIFRYTVIGDGPLASELEALAGQLQLGEHVSFQGARSRSDVLAAMARADILVAPSLTARTGDSEGIPVTIMEAMASQLAVVSTWHSGIPELVEHGVSGLLVPEGDDPALGNAIQFLAMSSERRREMGRAGRRIVAEMYDVDRLNDRLAGLLARLSLPSPFEADGTRQSSPAVPR